MSYLLLLPILLTLNASAPPFTASTLRPAPAMSIPAPASPTPTPALSARTPFSPGRSIPAA